MEQKTPELLEHAPQHLSIWVRNSTSGGRLSGKHNLLKGPFIDCFSFGGYTCFQNSKQKDNRKKKNSQPGQQEEQCPWLTSDTSPMDFTLTMWMLQILFWKTWLFFTLCITHHCKWCAKSRLKTSIWKLSTSPFQPLHSSRTGPSPSLHTTVPTKTRLVGENYTISKQIENTPTRVQDYCNALIQHLFPSFFSVHE